MQKQEDKTEKKYYSQIDEFRVTQDKVYNDLNIMINEYIKNNKSQRGIEVKNIYHSFLNLSVIPVKKHITNFIEKDRNNLMTEYIM